MLRNTTTPSASTHPLVTGHPSCVFPLHPYQLHILTSYTTYFFPINQTPSLTNTLNSWAENTAAYPPCTHSPLCRSHTHLCPRRTQSHDISPLAPQVRAQSAIGMWGTTRSTYARCLASVCPTHRGWAGFREGEQHFLHDELVHEYSLSLCGLNPSLVAQTLSLG